MVTHLGASMMDQVRRIEAPSARYCFCSSVLLCRDPDAAQRGPVGALAEGGRSTEGLSAFRKGETKMVSPPQMQE